MNHKVILRRKFLSTYQDVYIDDSTRISYGFHLKEAGSSYWLQRKINGKWKFTGAWTYFGGTVESVLDYLLWKEKEVNRLKAARVSYLAYENAE